MCLVAVLSDRHGKPEDSLIVAGTGSGKTLPIALNILLDDPAKKLVTITFSPLKRLQVTQENDFKLWNTNCCYQSGYPRRRQVVPSMFY